MAPALSSATNPSEANRLTKTAAQRYEDERLFHNTTFSENTITSTTKYYSITACSLDHYYNTLLTKCRAKQVLEYGCGTGSAAFKLAANQAFITGIDISDLAIEKARQETQEHGLKATYVRMNAEETTFESGRFDLICGTGILHHLNLASAYPELSRILRPDGLAIFIEPMGHNPLINLYRRLTPSIRTEDEHPLLMRDVSKASAYFANIKATYYHLFTLAAVPFRKLPFFNGLVKTLTAFDDRLFRWMPWAGRYAWMVVLEFSGPLKSVVPPADQ